MKKYFTLMTVGLLSLFLAACAGKTAQTESKETAKTDQQPVELYLVRHGKTMFNTTGQVQGWSDTPLTDVGIEQAKQAGKALKDIEFVSAYSSDMGRALHTAKYILGQNEKKKDLQITELEGLREWGYGGYEGRDDAVMWTPLFNEKGVPFKADWSTWEQFTAVMSDEEIANAIAKNDPTKTAENYSQIIKRSKQAIDQIVKSTESRGGGKVLVVSHGSEIPTILSIYTPGSYHGELIKNGSVTILKYEKGKYTLERINDDSYLKK